MQKHNFKKIALISVFIILSANNIAAEITFVRFGPLGEEKPGILDNQNQIRDLSNVIADITPQQLSDEAINRIAQIPIEDLPIISGNPRIGAKYISEQEVFSHIAGFTVGHDVSERAFQRERGGQFTKGKSADTFAPIGPYLVTRDRIDDIQNLPIWSEINGEMRQQGNTADMVFNVKQIVSHLSQFMTLNPGDIIFTGTPEGVGDGMTPPSYLKPGDIVRVGISGLGAQRQSIVAAE